MRFEHATLRGDQTRARNTFNDYKTFPIYRQVCPFFEFPRIGEESEVRYSKDKVYDRGNESEKSGQFWMRDDVQIRKEDSKVQLATIRSWTYGVVVVAQCHV